MQKQYLSPKHIQDQKGSTLFICLIMLLAISVISLAGMRTSILELVIAKNKQQFSNTFQAAENVINTRISALNLIVDGNEVADVQIGALQTDVINNSSGQEIASVDSAVFFRTVGPALGFGLNNVAAFHFQMDATAEAPAQNAVANYSVGFFILAPGPGG